MGSNGAVCVFCGAADGSDPVHREHARRLGDLLADNGLELVFGGGHVGLMGVVAERVLARGGRVTGIIPEHLYRPELAYEGVTELVVTEGMSDRKDQLIARSDSFITLGGGLGTLDEFFEVLTQRQLGLHAKPVVLLNSGGYWNGLLDLIEAVVGGGFMHHADRALYQVADTPDAAVAAVQ